MSLLLPHNLAMSASRGGNVPGWVKSLARPYGIVQPVLAVDPYGGRYFRGDAKVDQVSAINTSRAGSAFMLGDGAYQTFATNEPPSILGVGLDVYRQIAPLLYSSADMTVGTYWTASNGATVKDTMAPDGTTNATTFTEDTSTGFHGFVGNNPNRPSGVAGTKYTAYACVGKGQTRRYVILWWGTGGEGVLATLDTQTGTITECVVTGGDYTIDACGVEDAGAAWRVWTTGSKATGFSGGVIVPVLRGAIAPVGNGSAPAYLGDGSTIIVWDFNLVAADFLPPPNPTGASLTPRYATTVTDPDFPSLVSAFGLDGGFRVGARVAFERLSAGNARCVWAAGEDADNHARLDISTANTAKFTLRKAAVDVLVMESGAFAAIGEKDIFVVAKDGAWLLEVTGVPGDADNGVYGLPDLADFRYGSNFGDTDYFNGTMQNLVLGRAA